MIDFPQREVIDGLFEERLARDWEVLASRERHGSWEWEAQRWPDKRRPRAWVVFAVTPLELEDGVVRKAVTEGWALAEIRQRFTRQLMAAFELDLEEEQIESWREIVGVQIRLAAGRAVQIRADEIGSTYPELELMSRPDDTDLGPVRYEQVALPTFEEADWGVAWRRLLGERREVSLTEAAARLGLPPAQVVDLALSDIEAGRIRVEQRQRELYFVAAPGSLEPGGSD